MSNYQQDESIRITKVGRDRLVELSVTRSEGNLAESISLAVSVPLEFSTSVQSFGEQAIRRAIEILQEQLPNEVG